MIGDAVFEEKAGWQVVPIIGRDKEESSSWGFDCGATTPDGLFLKNPSAVAFWAMAGQVGRRVFKLAASLSRPS